jgi:hypothetical protein
MLIAMPGNETVTQSLAELLGAEVGHIEMRAYWNAPGVMNLRRLGRACVLFQNSPRMNAAFQV